MLRTTDHTARLSSLTTLPNSAMTTMVAKKRTDWYSWLRRSALDPAAVHEYSLLFSQNELDQGDITHFDHPFLQSMGITIAKHRLEILKLAKNDSKKSLPLLRPVSHFVMTALRKAKRRISEMVKGKREEKKGALSTLVVVEKPSNELFVGTMLKRSKSMGLLGQRNLIITGGSLRIAAYGHRHSCRVARTCDSVGDRSRMLGEDEMGGDGEENMCWDSMFQGMKPT